MIYDLDYVCRQGVVREQEVCTGWAIEVKEDHTPPPLELARGLGFRISRAQPTDPLDCCRLLPMFCVQERTFGAVSPYFW